MFLADLPFILTWWLVFLLIGIIFLPLTMFIFSRFVDRGYIFSKILGMLLVSYAVFVLGTLRILPFFQESITFVLITWGGISLFLLWKNRETLVETLQKGWKLLLFEELIFLIALSFWSYIRAHEPSIHGLEKYMDFGFINSILRTDYFPAKDLWLTPLNINYYYLGQLVTAVLTKLSNLDPSITYNLMIATLFGFTFVCTFSIGLNLVHAFLAQAQKTRTTVLKTLRTSVVAGLLSGFLVALAGNLHTIYAFFTAYNGDNPVPFWTLPLKFDLTGYWYPNATRFIPFTIHEFPIYSFVVSDLHGHVLSIPIVLTIIALLLHTFISRLLTIPKIILLSFLLAISYTTNAWDGFIYFLLAAGIIIFLKVKTLTKPYIFLAIYYILFLTVGFFILTLPFSLFFKPFVSGIGVICAPEFLTQIGKIGPFLFEKDHCQRSALWQPLILHGFWYFWIVSFVIFLRKQQKIIATDRFILFLIGLSTLLILLPEFFYAKDIYPAHYRANTMFKLGYQAFMMFGISTGYIIVRIILDIKHHILYIGAKEKIFTSCYLLLATFPLFLVSIYPYFAINSYYGKLKVYHGLDGLAYLKDLYPTDYEAILWIRENIAGQPVMLEAAGESYTDYARISANTGLPTVIGWPVHEWLWRGSYDEPGKRVTEVEQIYTTQNIEQTKILLTKYHVAYVFIGTLERQKYPKLVEEKFKQLGIPIYQNGQIVIYQLDNRL